MADSARILVITPTLGESEFLDQTVKSVTAQPLSVRHIISTPLRKCPALRHRFPQAQVVADGGKEGGIYGALNSALGQAGDDWDWFTYINDDDALLPGFAETVFRHLHLGAPESVIYGDVELIDKSGKAIAPITTERNPAWIPAVLQQGISPLVQQGMLFRRDVVRQLQRFDIRYRLCADLDFWLRAYVEGAAFRYYPERVAQFRLRNGQLSASTAVTLREQNEIVRRLFPTPVSSLKGRFAGWRYRLYNLPRYWVRTRARGFVTSYELLQSGSHYL